MNPVVFVVGPTACGKSQLALGLAEHFRGSILNCDSLQVYRRLDIGTAKPSLAERSSVPHLLFDCVEPGQSLTAGDFRRMALAAIEKPIRSGPVFAVGGSGFYIQALEKGMFEVEKPSPEIDQAVRDRLAQDGLTALYQELEERDPEYAEMVSPNDAYRVMRALVVIEDTGQKMSDLRKQFKPQLLPYPMLKLGLNLDREALLPRVQARVEDMLEQGLVSEVAGLLRDGFGQWPALASVGYKECVEFLSGRLAEPALAPLINEKTMQLAKKQRTWFKRDAEIQWLPAENSLAEAIRYVTLNARWPR